MNFSTNKQDLPKPHWNIRIKMQNYGWQEHQPVKSAVKTFANDYYKSLL